VEHTANDRGTEDINVEIPVCTSGLIRMLVLIVKFRECCVHVACRPSLDIAIRDIKNASSSFEMKSLKLVQ